MAQKNYIARLTGTSEKYGFERDFVYVGELQFSRGVLITYDKEVNLEDGLYEIGNGYNNKYKDYVVVENGKIKDIAKEEALAIVEKNEQKEEEIDGEIIGEVTEHVGHGVTAGKISKKNGEYFLNGKKLTTSDMIEILDFGKPKFISDEEFEKFDEIAFS